MPYKPKFCCQCGENIDRTDWKLWTSRRFCELCETEFGVYDKIRWIVPGIILLFGLFGMGSYFQKPEKQLNISAAQPAASNRRIEPVKPKTDVQVSSGDSVQTTMQSGNFIAPANTRMTQSASNLKIKPATPQIVEAAEKVYFCGAPTKKGTMCSRRVKNGGRCWQHQGQAAHAPQDKLLAVQ